MDTVNTTNTTIDNKHGERKVERMTTYQAVWDTLTKPHRAIISPEQQRQSRLLAALMIGLAASIAVSVFLLGLRDANLGIAFVLKWTLIRGFVLPIMAAVYFLNRRGYYHTAAYIAVITAVLFIHGAPLLSGDIGWLYYTIPIIVLTSLLLTQRQVIWTIVVSLGAQALLFILLPSRTWSSNLDIVTYFFITASIILVYTTHRTAIERIRQSELRTANDNLRLSEASLEKRVADRTRELQIAASELSAAALERSRLLDEVQVAQTQAELLYRLSGSMNAAQSYTAIVDAISLHLNKMPDHQVGLATFENFNKSGAGYFEVVASHSLGMPNAVAMNVRFDAAFVHNLISPEVLVITDLNTDTQLQPGVRNYYLQNHVQALMIVGIVLGEPIVGFLSITSAVPHEYTESEIQFIRAAADLCAAALDRVRLYNEQVKTAEQLRTLDQMKSQFLASMSHELRTPLNAILNFTEFVSMGMLGPVNDKQHEVLDKSLGSGKHLLALINDVLDITKIEAGMMQLFVESDIDLRKEIDAVTAATEIMIKDKPVQFIKIIPDDLPLMVGDRRRIRQILLNLLSNATKFTESGTIRFSVEIEQDQGQSIGNIRFTVRDTGPGIALEDQALIFEPFVQTEVGIRHTGGTGLGLPISKRLVEAHGGRLWLESDPGHGAAFFVTLPVQSEELLKKNQPAYAG